MSLKPDKKSDLKKSWMQPRRDKAQKLQPEYHLIVTEGTDTEPAYFGAIKSIINSRYRGRIQLEVIGAGDNTLSLLAKATRLAAANPNGYQHVWVVYDTDDFPAEHIDQTVQLCRKYTDDRTDDISYHAIWSNQCIEMWFLLHFSYMHADIHRKEYWPKLSEILIRMGKGPYTKDRTDMYTILHPRMERAIKNARRLAEVNAGKLPSQSAPGTTVYELIETLKPYLDEAAQK